MRFFYLSLSAFAALAAAADNANPFNIPTEGYTFTAGKPTTLTWQPTTEGSVTLRLQWGSVLTADSGSVIARMSTDSFVPGQLLTAHRGHRKLRPLHLDSPGQPGRPAGLHHRDHR
jgi:hypothetical protein